MSIEVTYSYDVRRVDTINFHGWVVVEISDGMKEDIFSSSSLAEVRAFMRDLGVK